MFQRFGQFVVQSSWAWLAVWIAAVAAVAKVAPPLESVVQTGEFAFLPEQSPSRQAERLFAEAFPQEAQASTIAIVIQRRNSLEPLTDAELNFVDNENQGGDGPPDLRDQLLTIMREAGLIFDHAGDDGESAIHTFRHKTVGRFLLSPDRRATLILIPLEHEFMDHANAPLVSKIEAFLFNDSRFQQTLPPGLEVLLSGTAVVGRDMLRAAKDSAKATEHLTIVLVIALLVLIYQAPLLALVPLMTVYMSVRLAMGLLCLMADRDWIVLFSGIESYVTVLLYGAGVDYCLFLIARYKEEVDQGIGCRPALADSVGYVGAAIAASAGTVICGIGMMTFAEFGKFHDAGIAISFGLVVVLLASLTFTPALLSCLGRPVFWKLPLTWPVGWLGGRVRASHAATEAPSSGWLQNLWDHVGVLLVSRPLTIWLLSLAAMTPFALVGIWFYSDLSYGLLTDLPATSRSVVGTKAVSEHFPAGTAGPVTVLLRSRQVDFSSDEAEGGLPIIHQLTQALREHRVALRLSDVRSVSHPFGSDEPLESIENPVRRKATAARSIERYVSQAESAAGHVTRLELTAEVDPFARESITHLGVVEAALRKMMPDALQHDAEVFVLGPTASIRDLKHVTDRDQIRIDSLVIVGVFAILVLLLRQAGVCLYLIVSVLFSYLVTLGFTYLSFWYWDGANFAGLDWKVPMFLFTILIAVGEDYNIFLMSRIEEEQRRFGPVGGVAHALSRTGRIISSCGIIMAGTFASLAAGSLKGMSQLGYALAFGVLLDTFVVRPVLVPAYLVLLHGGQFGRWGRWLGAVTPESISAQATSSITPASGRPRL